MTAQDKRKPQANIYIYILTILAEIYPLARERARVRMYLYKVQPVLSNFNVFQDSPRSNSVHVPCRWRKSMHL